MGNGNDIKVKKPGFRTLFPLMGFIPFVMLFALPVMLVLSHAGNGEIIRILSTPYYLRLIRFTVFQALLSTLISLAAGLPAAYLLSNYNFRAKRFFRTVFSVPFVLPSIIVVLGFVIFYGNSGYLNTFLMAVLKTPEPPLRILYRFPAVIAAHVFYNFPVIVSVLTSQWSSLPGDCEECATIDGANPVQVFFNITLPRLLPSVASACSLVFLYCFTSFAIILVLGGGPSLSTIEVEIYRKARLESDIATASALSLVSLFFVSLILIVHLKLERKVHIHDGSSYHVMKKLGKKSVPAYIYLFIAALGLLLPMVSVAARSLFTSVSRGGASVFSLKAYQGLLKNPSAILNSVVTAIFSSVFGTICALSVCYYIVNGRNKVGRRIASFSVLLPLAVSSIILGLGYFMISDYFRNLHPLLILVPVHSIIIIPFAVRTILPAYRNIPVSLTEDALTMGAKDFRIFISVHLPFMRRAVISSLAFGFAISIGELNSTVLLGFSTFPTIPMQIYALIGSYNYQGACAMGTLLILICFLAFSFRSADQS